MQSSPPNPSPARSPATRGFEAFLCALIALGVGCRFYGLNWDEGLMLHPDERFLLDVASRIGWPSSWAQWFDSGASPFNPLNLRGVGFVYGQWPLLLLKGADSFGLGSPLTTGRALSALFDSLTIGLTFLISRRVLPRHWALFAAALTALAALHVQQSHFFTVDNFAAFWMLASFWAGARWQDQGRARDALLAGAALGIAMACKISAFFIGVPLLVLLLYGVGKHPRRHIIAAALGCIMMALVCFRVFQPMAFVGAWGFFDVRPDGRFWDGIAGQAAITRGATDVPFNVQWIGRAPWLFSLRNLGFWGYGWGLLVSGAVGAIIVVWNWRKRDERAPILLASALFCAVLLGVQGATFSKFTRYFLPLTPLLALLAAYAWQWLSARARWLRVGAPLVAGFTALWCVAVTGIYARTHPRVAASRWIVSHIAPGTRVAVETPWDEGLPLGANSGDLRAQMLDSFAPDTPEKRENLLQVLDESEWIFQSSGRSWQNIPRWPAKWPMTSRFYYALWQGELGFERAREFTSYPQLGPLQFPDDDAEEALSVYDHPRVILWKKSPNYSPARTREILESVPLPMPEDWQPRKAG